MYKRNWKKNLAPSIRNPLFDSYGSFSDPREVLVDCSFGVNPLRNLYHGPLGTLSLDGYNMYPSGGPHSNKGLADFITSRWPTVPAEAICFSAGSQGAITSLAKIIGGEKSRILGYLPQFLPALLEFSLSGTQVDTLNLEAPDFRLNVDSLLSALKPDTTAVYVDSPNNPTGRPMPLSDVKRLAEGCAAQGALLIMDEAYADFIDDEESALNLDRENIICLRSFSKGCGLAGLRIGYIVIRDKELRDIYYELGLQFACSALAADVAANLLPTLDLAGMRQELKDLKQQTVNFMGQTQGIFLCDTHPQTPIVLVGWNGEESLYNRLMEHGILTEPGRFFGIDDSRVRLRIPSPTDFSLFCELWDKAFTQE